MPIRYARMMASPFAFMRGSAIVMANDLASTPKTGIQAQLCGDAHLLNFGAYASPERALLFDLNDFDETLPGPWEWDIKRLAASFVVAGRDNGFDAADCREAARASRGLLPAADGPVLGDGRARGLVLARWRGGSQRAALRSQEQENDHEEIEQDRAKSARPRQPAGPIQADQGRRWAPDDKRRPAAPGPHPRRGRASGAQVYAILESYKRTLQDDRRHLLDRYRFVDVARKVVGVGSVGTRAYVVLLEGRDEDDPLFLQVKEAGASVLEGHAASRAPTSTTDTASWPGKG